MFHCYFKNRNDGRPYTILKPVPCDTQCARCEEYQAGREGYDPRLLPVKFEDTPFYLSFVLRMQR